MTNSIKLNHDKLPAHIAIIMDGNRRWAKQQGLNPFAGHKQVVEHTAEALINHAGHLGIPFITLWTWSSENWNRPPKEVNGIMKLLNWSLKHQAQKFIDKGARLNVIGDISKFPPEIINGIHESIEKSKQNTKITVTFALNYGGRDELVRATNKIVSKQLPITPQTICDHLDTRGLPNPDLIIRPGGRKRLSGFLLWQSEYAELYFTNTLMPDFGPDELDLAIADYQSRQRTFGGGSFEKICF